MFNWLKPGGIIIGLLVILTACQTMKERPTTPLVLSSDIKDNLHIYLSRRVPGYFAISEDGQTSASSYCAKKKCAGFGNDIKLIKSCERQSGGVSCHTLADGHEVSWDGAVNYMGAGQWCDNNGLRSAACYVTARRFNKLCSRQGTDYDTCRKKRLEETKFTAFNSQNLELVVCEIRDGEYAFISIFTCKRVYGTLTRAIIPITFSWPGVHNKGRGHISYMGFYKDSRIIFNLPGKSGACEGSLDAAFYWNRAEDSNGFYGDWSIKCPSGEFAKGEMKSTHPPGIQVKEEGKDNQGRRVTILFPDIF